MPTRVVPGMKGKGKSYTLGDGYYFVKNGKPGKDGKFYVKCTGCSIRGKLVNGNLWPNPGDHCHAPDFLFGEVSTAKDVLKRESSRTLGGKMGKVFSDTCAGLDESVQSEVTYESCRSSMYRARAGLHPPVPHDMEELQQYLVDPQFVEKYGTCKDGTVMARGLIGPEGHKSLVFTCDVVINILLAATWVFLDGTFSARPDNPESRQLLVITALYNGSLFPVCFALMMSKAEIAYRALFSFLRDLAPGLSPANIVTDFEAALVSSPIADIFPGTNHQGCWFHYCQALYRMIGHLGLTSMVKNSYTASMVIRMCYVLPLLPPDKMVEGLNAIEYTVRLNGLDDLMQFFEYIRDIWMTRIGPELLSVYRSKHRTNNFVESYHKALQDRIGSLRPGTWDFIKAIVAELNQAYTDVIRVQSDLQTSRGRKGKWMRQDKRILRLLMKLDSNDISVLDFLVAAQNVTRSLQKSQLHLSRSTNDDPIGYPVALAAMDDPDDELIPTQTNENIGGNADQTEGAVGYNGDDGDADLFATQPSTSNSQAMPNPVALLMPPAHLDFTSRVVPTPAVTATGTLRSPPQEPDVSPVRGRRRGRPRLARPAGVANGRGPRRPRGARGGRYQMRGRGRGRGRPSVRGEGRPPVVESEEESEPEDTRDRNVDDPAANAAYREQQQALQDMADAAAVRAAATGGEAAAHTDVCRICLEEPNTHAAVPCGHKAFFRTCAERLEASPNVCPLCRREIIVTVHIFN